MSAAPGVAAARRAWLFVTGSMAESFVVYAIVGWFLARGRGAEGDATGPSAVPAYGTAAVFVAAAALLLRQGAVPGTTPGAFQKLSFLAIALLSLNALVGLFLSIALRRLEPALVLPGTSLAAALFLVFPSGLAFWRRAAEGPARDAGAPPSLGPS